MTRYARNLAFAKSHIAVRLHLQGLDSIAVRGSSLERQLLCLFSTELNPIANGESSIPLQLYRDIDIAVKKKDINHSKLNDLRRNLLLAISRLIRPKNRLLARELRREIRTAPVEMFRPQIWRIDLRKVAASRWKKDGARPGWDEQYVTDLKATEFEILVE